MFDIIAHTNKVISPGTRKDWKYTQCALWSTSQAKRSKANSIRANQNRARESSWGDSESPQFFHYGQKSCHMMERMGYDFTKESSLNFGKGKRALFCSFVPKGKDPDYYHKIQWGLSYISTPISSDSESKIEVYHDSSLTTSSWYSNVSVSDIFESLSVTMVSVFHYIRKGEKLTIKGLRS